MNTGAWRIGIERLPAQLPEWLAGPCRRTPALLLALLCVQPDTGIAAPLDALGNGLPPLPAAALESAGGLAPYRSGGHQDGFAYSYSTDASAPRLAAGERGAQASRLSQQFGLGREFDSGAGAISIGGAVGLARSEVAVGDYWAEGRAARLAFGPQLGYRSDPHSHFAAEVVGSYFYSRNHWVGHSFVGWRDNDGWAVGPELWRLGNGLSRSNGGGLAIHDVRLAPLRLGFRVGLETRSALGRRYIGGVELSWDSP